MGCRCARCRHSVRSREIPAFLSLHYGYCDFAQHDGLVIPPPPIIPGVAAKPKLRHSRSKRRTQTSSFRAQSRNPCLASQRLWPSLSPTPVTQRQHGYCDFAQHDGLVIPRPPIIPGVAAKPKLRHSRSKRRTQTSSFRAQSRNPCIASQRPWPSLSPTPVTQRQHGYCDFAQHDGLVIPRPPIIPGVAAKPKLRHSRSKRRTQTSSFRAQSRNPCLASQRLWPSLSPTPVTQRQHGYCDFAQHDGLVIPPPPIIPGVAAKPKLRHSRSKRRTQTSSFRAQSRNPCIASQRPWPSLSPTPVTQRQHGYCDFAQHDGLVIPPPPIIPGIAAKPKLRHSRSKRRTQTSSFRAQSRNPCIASQRPWPSLSPTPVTQRQHGYCDFAQHDGLVIPRPPIIPGVAAKPKLRHSRSKRRTQTSSFRAQSRNPCLASQRPWPSLSPTPVTQRQHGYCDFAQHDGLVIPRPPIIPGVAAKPKLRHSRSKRRTQTSSFRAQSRNPCPQSRHELRRYLSTVIHIDKK